MNQSPELDQLAAALCQAQAEFTAIPKDSTNPFFKSQYAALPRVVEVASPILTEHGLAVAQFIGHENGFDTLTTWLLHKSGQFIADSMKLHLAKDDPQGQGSATTYARRYSYMAVLGLVADEDDDGNKAVAARKVKPVDRITKPVAESLAKRAARAEVLDRLQLAASHVSGGDIGPCETTDQATVALQKLSVEEAARVGEWITGKEKDER